MTRPFFTEGATFDLPFTLDAVDYIVALGVFANESKAETYGGGLLSDEFSGLGQPDLLGNYYYKLEVTMPDEVQVPEPGTFWLILSGLVGLIGVRKRFLQIG